MSRWAAGAMLGAALLAAGCTAPLPAPVAVPTSGSAASTIPDPPSGLPARVPIVVLDPGHNGGNGRNPQTINRPVPDGRGGTKACNTTGTSTDAGYAEHTFTFDVAQRVSALLTSRGLRVVLTRTDDTGVGPCVDVRGSAGQDADADVVVSIHADGASASGRGFHVIHSAPPLAPVQGAPTAALARAMRDALRDAGFSTSTYAGRDGLAPRPDIAGLNHARVPAVLVECANMRNAEEAALVSSPAGRARYAEAIVAGILAFLAR